MLNSLSHPSTSECPKMTKIKLKRLLTFTKSGNGYKKTATHVKILISTIRAIINKCLTTGAVMNLPGRGRKCCDVGTINAMTIF
jgi:hypothetical protein